ncbi:MAG: DUF1579 family protein [Deltaproteobacteria bacterium]|nr:DUF1579 family protein [Nannocystaceae bacterium]
MPTKPKPVPKAPIGERLAPLLGSWAMEATFPMAPDKPVRGTASFRWLAEPELVQMRSRFGKGGPPTSISVIGGDDASKSFMMLYSDERGVARHMTMTLTKKAWELSAQTLEFAQRYRGTISADGRTIRGAWEMCEDGETWEHDFALVYTRRD